MSANGMFRMIRIACLTELHELKSSRKIAAIERSGRIATERRVQFHARARDRALGGAQEFRCVDHVHAALHRLEIRSIAARGPALRRFLKSPRGFELLTAQSDDALGREQLVQRAPHRSRATW